MPGALIVTDGLLQSLGGAGAILVIVGAVATVQVAFVVNVAFLLHHLPPFPHTYDAHTSYAVPGIKPVIVCVVEEASLYIHVPAVVAGAPTGLHWMYAPDIAPHVGANTADQSATAEPAPTELIVGTVGSASITRP